MSNGFREYAKYRDEKVKEINTIQSDVTDSQLNALLNSIVESDLFLIAHELDRLCDILERKK